MRGKGSFVKVDKVETMTDKGIIALFVDESDLENLGKDMVAFDIRSGEFSHYGDMCTFEVLIKIFGLKDRILRKIAEIVYELLLGAPLGGFILNSATHAADTLIVDFQKVYVVSGFAGMISLHF